MKSDEITRRLEQVKLVYPEALGNAIGKEETAADLKALTAAIQAVERLEGIEKDMHGHCERRPSMENMVVKLSDGSVYRFRNVAASWIEGKAGDGSDGCLLTIRYEEDDSDKTGYARFGASHYARFGTSHIVFAGNEDIFNQQLAPCADCVEEAEQ